MNCPSCGQPLDSRGIDLDAGTIRCLACGHVSPLSTTPAAAAAPRLPQPPATRVVLDRSRPGQIVLSVPGQGGCGLLFFAGFWLLLVIGLTIGLLVFDTGPMVLILIPFWLVGIVFAILGSYTRYGITGVYLDKAHYLVTKKLWGKGWTRRGGIDQIESISVAEAYEQNNRPVMAVSISLGGRKTIKFGSFLTDEEKKWITSELRAFMAEIGRPLAW